MASKLITLPFRPTINLRGGVEAGAKLFVYSTGTTTPVSVYSDSALTTPLANPVVADAFGVFPDVYYNDAQVVRVVMQQANGTVLSDTDPYISDTASAEASADAAATSAAAAEAIARPIYANNAAGLAATAEGDFFFVDQGDGTADLYRHDAGPTATAMGRTTIIDPQGSGAAGLIGYTQGGSGAVDRTVQDKLRETVSVRDFGAVGDGVANDTTALSNFFNHCIENNAPGHIPAGTYLIDLGSLAFDNNHVSTPFPNIATAGEELVIFKAASNADAAFLAFTNGTASSGVGNFWRGGGLGGITFESAAGSVAGLTSMHGLVLRGVQGTTFGNMVGVGLGGDTIRLPRLLFGGINPDPYHVANCVFEGVEARENGGYAFYNDNYNGFTLSRIQRIRAVNCGGGPFFGPGAGNVVDVISAGSCAGWAIGDNTDAAGGPASKFVLRNAEFDDIRNGLQLARCDDFNISCRFIHRYNFTVVNTDNAYWPLTVANIASTGRSSGHVLNLIHRIEAGGTLGDLGTFYNFNSAGGNSSNISIKHQVLDNASLSIADNYYLTNFNTSSRVKFVDSSSDVIFDNTESISVLARAPSSFSVPNGGFTTAPNTVQYSTELYDPSAAYDPASYTFTAPATGLYNIRASIVLVLTAGVRVQIGLMVAGFLRVSNYSYAGTSNAELHYVEATLLLTQGQAVTVNAATNAGGATGLSTVFGVDANHLSIHYLG